MLVIKRKYNTATTINFPLYLADGSALATGRSFATGDVKFSNNEGAFSDTDTTTPTEVATSSGIYSLALLATEVDAARVVIRVVDQTDPQTWLDQIIIIETYGNASAQHAFDLDAATQDVNVASIDANAITATAIASNAITATKIASNAITAAKIATDAITAAKIAADAIGASELAADAITEIQSGLATAAALATAQLDLDTITGADGVNLLSATQASIDAIETDTGTTLPATLATAANLATVDTEVGQIKAKTDNLVFTKANEIDANVQSINGVTITGDGSATPFDV